MGKTILGRVGLVTAGNFVLGNPYKKNDIVSSDIAAYIAREDNKDIPLPNQTNDTWQLIGKVGKSGHSVVVLPNGNFGNWAEDTQSYVDSGIPAGAMVDVANAKVTFTESLVRSNIDTDEKVNIVFGKIRKWFSDLKALAFKDKIDYATDIENTPLIPTNTDQLENGANFQNVTQVNNSISAHNTSSTSHSDIRSKFENKVDKVSGKGLSTEDYTTEEKQKLAGLEGSKFKGEYISIEELESSFPTSDIGSYAYVDAGEGEQTQKYIWDSSDNRWVLSGSTGEETSASIKEKYESNPDTNAFSDAEKTKLSGLNKSVDKIANIAVANWVEQPDGTYNAIVYDTDILEDSKVSAQPADAADFDIYIESIVFSGISSAGQLLLKAKNLASDAMNINYTISV